MPFIIPKLYPVLAIKVFIKVSNVENGVWKRKIIEGVRLIPCENYDKKIPIAAVNISVDSIRVVDYPSDYKN